MVRFQPLQILHRTIKIAGRLRCFELATLRLVLRKLSLGVVESHVVGNLAGVREDVLLVELQEPVELRDPVGHVHRLATGSLQLGVVEVHRHDAIELG